MRFLSDEWFTATETALQTDERFREIAATARFRMLIVADSSPEWAQDGTLAVDHGKVTLETGRVGRPDSEGRADYDDWLAILRHELHPRKAVLTGRLRGKGMPALLANYRLVDTMLDVMRELPVDG